MNLSARSLLLTAVLVGMIGSTADAGPFSALYVFGDSLSDVGNLDGATGGIYPGSTYYQGRVSNGPVFVEMLADDLGLSPLAASRNGGTNFAFAGARTSGTGGLEGFIIQDVNEQVTSFLAGPAADPAALYMVFAGANDLVAGVTNMSTPINRLATDMGRLYDDGARRFFVPNLPLLGLTPRFNDTSQAETMNVRTESFNSMLAAMLDNLTATRAGIEIFTFDVASRFNEIIAEPSYFGFANVADEAAPGLQPGASNYNPNLIVAEPNTYLFWDDLHPTAPGHVLLAEAALLALLPSGDFNRDWIVDIADFTMWRDALGSTTALAADANRNRVIEAGDYAVWSTHFGASVMLAGTSSAASMVSEPELGALLGAWLLAWVLKRFSTAPATERGLATPRAAWQVIE